MTDLDALGVVGDLEVADARDLRQWTLAPPRSSIEMSSPVTALVRCGPASAIAPWPTTIGTKSERPGM